MHRLTAWLFIVCTTLALASCAKSEPEASVPPKEAENATAEASTVADPAPATTTETVVVVEEQPAATAPSVPPAIAEPEFKTVARPSLLLELMIEPIQFAALSTMQSLQDVARPLVTGSFPGLPGVNGQGDAEPKSDEPKAEEPKETPTETPSEPAADEAPSGADAAPPVADPKPE